MGWIIYLCLVMLSCWILEWADLSTLSGPQHCLDGWSASLVTVPLRTEILWVGSYAHVPYWSIKFFSGLPPLNLGDVVLHAVLSVPVSCSCNRGQILMHGYLMLCAPPVLERQQGHCGPGHLLGFKGMSWVDSSSAGGIWAISPIPWGLQQFSS